MRVEQERRNTQRQNGDPEIDQIRRPKRQCHIKQHEQRPHSKVDAGTRKSGEQDAEIDTTRRETTARGDISSTAKG